MLVPTSKENIRVFAVVYPSEDVGEYLAEICNEYGEDIQWAELMADPDNLRASLKLLLENPYPETVELKDRAVIYRESNKRFYKFSAIKEFCAGKDLKDEDPPAATQYVVSGDRFAIHCISTEEEFTGGGDVPDKLVQWFQEEYDMRNPVVILSLLDMLANRNYNG